MTDKPLEWEHRASQVDASEFDTANTDSGLEYIVWPDGTAWWTHTGHWENVPGPYDGTIDTAKQRCEEHRRNLHQ